VQIKASLFGVEIVITKRERAELSAAIATCGVIARQEHPAGHAAEAAVEALTGVLAGLDKAKATGPTGS
jgi:hypothetical protein